MAASAVAGCAPQQVETEVSGAPLAPRLSAEPSPPGGTAGKGRPAKPRDRVSTSATGSGPSTPPTPSAASEPSAATAGAGSTGGPSGTATPGSTSGTPGAPGGPSEARVVDGRGDVEGGTGAPAHVDLVGAVLSRTGKSMTLRVEVAGALPARQEDSRTQNVVLFVDREGDGQVDHELWASLADDGWSTSHRRPDGATYGEESGISVRVEGPDLVLGFTPDHVAGARTFRWALGTEWGTFEQVATGTTAQDLAPGTGSVAFPG